MCGWRDVWPRQRQSLDRRKNFFFFRPRVLVVAMQRFGLRWSSSAEFVRRNWQEFLEEFAMLSADESDEGRAVCAELTGEMEKMGALLSEGCDMERAAWALQLLGNMCFRNEQRVTAELLRLNLLPRILTLSAFNPEQPLTREWALVLVRNATEADPDVHAYLSKMQVLGIDRDNPHNQDLEQRTGSRLELVEGRPMLVRREEI